MSKHVRIGRQPRANDALDLLHARLLETGEELHRHLLAVGGELLAHRCQGGGPAFVRVGPKLIRYRLGDLREYAKGQPMGEGVQRAAMAMLAARTAKAEG